MKAPRIVRQDESVRVVVRTPAELFEEGKDDKGRYAGGKWGGLYLRAPDIYFRILEKAGDKLVRLGDVAEVRFGIKTGANEFFYLEPLELTVKDVAELRERDPKAPVRVRNGSGWEGEIEAAWLRPVLKSPREIRTIRVRLEDLRHLVFIPPHDVREAIEAGGSSPLERYPQAAAYIEWGERAVYVCQRHGCKYRSENPVCPRHGSGDIKRDALPERSSLASRPRWWDLGEREPAQVNCNYLLDDRMYFYFAQGGVYVSDNFQELHGGDGITAALASVSVTQLWNELGGRTPFGGGLLKVQTYEVARLAILNPAALTPIQHQHLLSTFERLSQREVKSIFEELGFPLCHQRRCSHPEHPYEHVHPESLTLEQIQKASPDRFELDRVVFDVLGLTDEERLETYRAVARLVKDRLTKAMSNNN